MAEGTLNPPPDERLAASPAGQILAHQAMTGVPQLVITGKPPARQIGFREDAPHPGITHPDDG
jgi:hypothetical protein